MGSVDAELVHWLYDWVPPVPPVPRGQTRGVGFTTYENGSAYLSLDVRTDGTEPLKTGHGPDTFYIGCGGRTGFAGNYSDGAFTATRVR